MRTFDLFPITIGLDYVDLTEHVKQIFDYQRRVKPQTNDKSTDLEHYQRTRDNNITILEQPKLRDLRQILETQANNYYHNSLGHKEELYITESWLNICHPGGHQVDHYHTNCVVSGTLYVVLDSSHPPLQFKNPRLMNSPVTPEIRCEIENPTPYSMTWTAVNNLTNGSVLYWPSYMIHGYPTNTSELDRVSLSFNLNIRASSFLYKSPFTLI